MQIEAEGGVGQESERQAALMGGKPFAGVLEIFRGPYGLFYGALIEGAHENAARQGAEQDSLRVGGEIGQQDARAALVNQDETIYPARDGSR
jgi:hypothetical protein